MDKNNAIKILKDIKEILDIYEVEFWLESGALLGAVREGKFIEWDYDIDLGTSDKYISRMKLISLAAKDKGFEVYYSHYNSVMGFWRDGISLDLPFWRMKKENAASPLRYMENTLGKILFFLDWILLFSTVGPISKQRNNIKYRRLRYYLVKITDYITPKWKIKIAVLLRKIAIKTGNRRGLVLTPCEYFLNLKTIEFYGMKLKAPQKAEEYLTYYYGKDWMTPKKNWNYMESLDVVLSKTEYIGLEWTYKILD